MAYIFPNSMDSVSGVADGIDVGVIMRTQNRPVLLHRALRSVIAQEHRDWHIYLVNDGGDPQPVDALVASLAEALAGRLTVIHHPVSSGRSPAANTALALVREAFTIVHDDDDSWQPTYLSTATAFLSAAENRRYGAVLSRWTMIEETIDREQVNTLATTVCDYEGEVVDFIDVLRRPMIPPIALLFRTAVIRAAGGMFNPDLDAVEDWDLNLRSLQLADIALIPQPLANYHIRRTTDDHTYSNSITSMVPTHERTRTLYNNAMVRALLQADPTQIGLGMTLLQELDRAKQTVTELQMNAYRELATIQKAMAERLENMEQGVEEMRAMLYDALRDHAE